MCVLVLSLVALSTLITSLQVVDRDGDGLRDSLEQQVHTNPLNTDSDNDAFPDGAEYAYWLNRSAKEHRADLAPTGDVDGDGLPNILDYDSDNDGLSDGRELELGTDPANPDTDHDGLNDGDEILRGTDPLNPDTNGNGILDGDEREGQNGENTVYTSNPPMTHELLRNGKGGNPICNAIFDPSLQSGDRMKRWSVCDAIDANYTAYIAQPQLIPLELSDVSYELQFRGEIPLGDPSAQAILIPSVSPTANIISYSSSLSDVSFHFFKDGADNYYVAASRRTGVHSVQLTIVTTANRSYFHPYDYVVPGTLTLEQIPQSVQHTPPASVREKAGLIVGDLGLTGEMNMKKILTTMVAYFSTFTEGDIPTPEQEPDTFLAVARAHHGACYERSFAFFITANAIGIPTRLVTNDCHAFVEVYIPPTGWEMIDLGGLGNSSSCNPNGYDVFDMGRPSGGAGGGGGGEEGGGTGGLLPTFVTITRVSPSADKNGTFLVEGTVTDAQETGLQNIDVDVMLNHTKKEQGILTGAGRTGVDGVFQIICTVPGGTQAGENQVVAHANRNEQYQDAWTDPPITIYTNTTITLTIPGSIGLGEEVLVQGTLTDIGGLPIEGATLYISWNGSRIGQTATDAKGLFNLSYTPSSPLGMYQVTVVYDGDQYQRRTQAEKAIYIKDIGTRLRMNVTPVTVERNHSIRIRGMLTSSNNETISFTVLNIVFNGEKVGNASTGGTGMFDTTWTVPRTVPPSNITIAVWFSGTDRYAEAHDERIVCVQSKTSLELLSPTVTTVHLNSNLTVTGKITDDQGQPVRSIGVEIIGTTMYRNVTTDENGLFNASLFFPDSFPTGTTSVRIACPGSYAYLPSQTQMDVTIVGVEPSYLPGIILLAIGVGAILGFVLVRERKKRKTHFEIQRSLEEIITEALSSLQTESDHRKTVLDCYQKMCDLLVQKGVIKDATQTPREFALVAKAYLRVPPENLYDFTKVYEKARYSSREVNEKDREKAIRCLRKIVFAPLVGRRVRKTRGVSG